MKTFMSPHWIVRSPGSVCQSHYGYFPVDLRSKSQALGTFSIPERGYCMEIDCGKEAVVVHSWPASDPGNGRDKERCPVEGGALVLSLLSSSPLLTVWLAALLL